MSNVLTRPTEATVNEEIASKVKKLVRKVGNSIGPRDIKELERRRFGACGMAIVAILLLLHIRQNYDSLLVIALETICSVFLLFLAGYLAKRPADKPLHAWPADRMSKWGTSSLLCTIGVVSIPWIVNPIAKQFGRGNGLEIVMLASLGWGSLSIALFARQMRTMSLSVVCSGFLTLFATFISDSSMALWFSLIWGVTCLWWLVNNYWIQVETTAAVGVQPARVQRFAFTFFGCLVFFLGTLLVAGRFPIISKLQQEWMPTSGGTSGKDSAARSGVGNGDALIAAKKHATSFGAVETEMFLDSEETGLFDVFSEEFGQPMFRKRHESAQSLSPEDVKSEEGKFTEGNRSSSGSEFSIDRELPAERKPVDDLVADSLMFWHGESGAHLAAQRFIHFDGIVWANPQLSDSELERSIECTVIGKQSWFGPSGTSVQNSISPFVGTLPEAMKFTRYRSATIPTRQGMQLWCIDQIDRQDFFAISQDDCLQMPDRDHVPDYTVVRMVNSQVDLERLESLVRHCSPGKSHKVLRDDCRDELNRLAHDFAGDLPRGWQQVQSIISGLRNQFTLDRTVQYSLSDPVEDSDARVLSQFVKQRRGPDYLFATTAALMLDHFGYRTRFVAGFYANPQHYLSREGEIAIMPSDAHAWLEIDVGHGYWIPLEPSPGYLEPQYAVSLFYRLNQNRWLIAKSVMGICVFALCIFLLRRVLFESFSWIALPGIFLLNDRLRVTWLRWLLDVRCKLAGIPRTKGTVLRKHLHDLQNCLPKDLSHQVQLYLESADRICFGGAAQLSKSDQEAIVRVWRGVTTRALQQGNRKMKQEQFI